jgi:glycosyltransferase involved in cell wall biosynthesis
LVTVSVVLPTYNRGVVLQKFFSSLADQSYLDWELIVVDDFSQDETAQIVAEYADQDSRISLCRLERHGGLPAARNAGVRASRGNLIFFGEDDIEFNDKDALRILVDTYFDLKEHYEVGALGSRLIGSNYDWLNDVVIVGPISGGIYHNFAYDPKKVIEVPTLHACSLIPREIFHRIGGYDERLYIGTYHKEEVDLYFRIRKSGYRLFFQPKSIIYHNRVGSGGCRENNWLKIYYYEFRNSVLFFSRFYGIPLSMRMLIYPFLRLAFPREAL